jgi:hypothetical protein
LIKWKGYKYSESTWEPRENIFDNKIIQKFEKLYKFYRLKFVFLRFALLLSFFAFLMFTQKIKLNHLYMEILEFPSILISKEEYDKKLMNTFPFYNITNYCTKNKLINVFNPYDVESFTYINYIFRHNNSVDPYLGYGHSYNEPIDVFEFFKKHKIQYYVLHSKEPSEKQKELILSMGRKKFSTIEESFILLSPYSVPVYIDQEGNKIMKYQRKD